MNLLTCKNCNIEFERKKQQIFCSRTCKGFYLAQSKTEEQKITISKKLSISSTERYKDTKQRENSSKSVGNYTKEKHKGNSIESILDVSTRTASKILKRLDIGCCICGWKEATCDIHHINGKKVNDADGHWNLTCVCPNHHRMYHNNKLKKEDFIPLTQYFPKNWKDVYYG